MVEKLWRGDAVDSNVAAEAPDAGESAIQRALEQVRHNPRDHQAYQQLSAAYAKDRQADDLALAAALQAIALEPKPPRPMCKRQRCMAIGAKPNEARRSCCAELVG